MLIKMVGLDHKKASIEYREKLSFTKEQILEALDIVKKEKKAKGCIILSTCNRTEIWFSIYEDNIQKNFNWKKYFCFLKQIDNEDIEKLLEKNFFIERNGTEAIEHLMMTACGINSRIFGEDQIISQIKDALKLSREKKMTERTLEKVFQNSIAAAKKVKSSIKLGGDKDSVATGGVNQLKKAYGDLNDKKCLIIGNGNMAGLIAEDLIACGADVTMTLRRAYHHGEEFDSLMPKGCHMISYDNRYEYLKDMDIVISATLSPHYTLTLEEIDKTKIKEPALWLDLAVPRDIDPSLMKRYKIKIIDIDGIDNESLIESYEGEILKAETIIKSFKEETSNWLKFRKQVPKLKEIVKITKEDISLRAESQLKNLNLDEETKRKVKKIIEESSANGINKLVFNLKETLNEELWGETVDALDKAAKKDTIKK